MSNGHREVFTGPVCLVPEVRQIGWSVFPKAKSMGLRQHRHPGHYEICYIVRGDVEWWVEDEVHEVTAGHVYITKPAEAHGGIDAVMNPCELVWLQVAVAQQPALPGLSAKETRELARGLETMDLHCFPGSPVLKDLVERLLAEVRGPREFSRGMTRAIVYQILFTLLRDHQRAARTREIVVRRSERIQQALDWIDQHLVEAHTVETLARQVGMGVSQFRKRFVAEMGLAPAEFIARRRIHHARRLLGDTRRSVTDIAFELGFSSSQYFATVFKRITGFTPGRYREKARK